MSRYRNNLNQWEGDTTQPYPVNFTVKSKRFLLPVRTTFGVARILADTGDRQDYYDSLLDRQSAIDRNTAKISGNVLDSGISESAIGSDIEINGDSLETVPSVGSYSGDFNILFQLYAMNKDGDMELKFSKEVYASDIPFRIPGGYKARAWEIVIVGNVPIKRIDMAGSMAELMESTTEEEDS